MMRVTRVLATAAVAASLMVGATAAYSQAPGPQEIVLAQASKRAAPRHVGTHVYLLRGFMDIFSTGMDDLGVKLNRRGIRATVHGHAEYPTLVEAIVSRYRRGIRENVVIIGHSLGANDAFSMAEALGNHGIPVPLIIAYDPTTPMTASRNVSRVINFYASNNGWGVAVGRGPGFRGSLTNIDLSRRGEMGHTDIDKSPALHAQSINYIQSIGGGRSSSASAGATSKDPSQDKSSEGKPESKKGSAAATAAKPAAPDDTASAAAAEKPQASPETTASTPAAANAGNEKGEKTETAASTPAKSKPASEKTAEPDVKPTGDKAGEPAAKPASEKTETAASPAANPSTSN